MKKYRVGIDVGGTFTDAVAVDNDTYDLVGSVKIPTTHSEKEGVAAGIVQVLHKLMETYNIQPEQITFIAHGTTQATNALLEGDVAKVGIITLGTGIEGMKAKTDTTMGDIPLAAGKMLESVNEFVNTADMAHFDANVTAAIKALQEKQAKSLVVSEAFSVDDPTNENRAIALCMENGSPATAGNDVSKLYGLKVRTRTAVVNASILPKMLDAANMTEESIKNANITAPLMVMRCDGGVMTVEEVRNRPILTILSGPAAGVAGALMYEKLTDGIFMEVGGTSTDISCVKDGSVMVKYAEVGGHKTYLTSLDVRTVGIGGGSMVEIKNGIAVDVGPRSAHIAGLPYECYTTPDKIENPVLRTVRPMDGDPEYAYIETADGSKYALTQSGAANICGYVNGENYAAGNVEAARKAWKPLADNMGLTVEECAKKVLDLSAVKNGKVVEALIKDYNLDKSTLVFVGGGGGAATVAPHLAETFGVPHRIAKNAAVISPIGVALAMVRDMVERVCLKPTEEDLLAIRREAFDKAVHSGAAPESITVKVEVDSRINKIRAIAIGTTELRTKNLADDKRSDEELCQIAAASMKVAPDQAYVEASNGYYRVISSDILTKVFILFKKKIHSIRLIDQSGVIRLQRRNAYVHTSRAKAWRSTIRRMLEEYTETNDGGSALPNLYVISGTRIIELCSMQSEQQVYSLAELELSSAMDEEELIYIATMATENQRS